MPPIPEMLNALTLLTLGVFGYSEAQDWSDSYMDAYRVSHFGDPYTAKDDGSQGISGVELHTLKPIFGVLTAIAKIMLKITLFKVIIKFATIICLLFFIPWLKIPDMFNGDAKDTGRMNELDINEILENGKQKYERNV